ncbi:hypothetical protein HY417_02915 [Candidatus Kaiserbacteria bacterium]|nr:hypothetical protein [Candidatus Kaiserbacteria bacterium]
MKSALVGNTHIVAGGQEMVERILDFLRGEGIAARGNPDVYVRSYKHFGVVAARELRSRASLKPLGNPSKGLGAGRRVFVVSASDINREAQNALLKTLEEPSGDALFIFIVPSPQTLLPTLRSRMQMLTLESVASRDAGVDIKQFLSSLPQKRLDLLKHLLEKGDDDKRDLGTILSFLSGLEATMTKSPPGLRAVYRARKYIADRGALVKPLLEQVALLLPRV